MPTYDYQCQDCGYEFEKLQSITASALRKCPRCGKMSLRRLIGCGAGVIFKGSGFYETDYRSDSYKKAAKSDTAGATKKSEKTEAKKDSNSDAKPAKSTPKKKSKKTE